MQKISGLVITYNEEKKIEDCLRSMFLVCDDIVVIDSYSTDKTVEIVKKMSEGGENNGYTTKIFRRWRSTKFWLTILQT